MQTSACHRSLSLLTLLWLNSMVFVSHVVAQPECLDPNVQSGSLENRPPEGQIDSRVVTVRLPMAGGGVPEEFELHLSNGPVASLVDAVSGREVWVAKPQIPAAATEVAAQFSPAAVSVVVGADGIALRAYFGDSGGNIWRLFFPNAVTAQESQRESNQLLRLASLAGADPLRFESAPVLLHSFDARGSSFDGLLLIGSKLGESLLGGPRLFYLRDYHFDSLSPERPPVLLEDLDSLEDGRQSDSCLGSRCLGWWKDLSIVDAPINPSLVVVSGRVFVAPQTPDSQPCSELPRPTEIVALDLRTGEGLADQSFLKEPTVSTNEPSLGDEDSQTEGILPLLPASVAIEHPAVKRLYWRDMLIDKD
ncbi:hypothetical protein [Congregibacter sp.]|uniref:hypothetical protein n=1 Tax=Congregibacter sp. TaxID=2744308 RepID=UPI003F6B04DD